MIDVSPFHEKLNLLKEYMDEVIEFLAMVENMRFNWKYKFNTDIHLLGAGKPSFEIWIKNKYGGEVDYSLN